MGLAGSVPIACKLQLSAVEVSLLRKLKVRSGVCGCCHAQLSSCDAGVCSVVTVNRGGRASQAARVSTRHSARVR
jgi:hypothetical protein